MGRTAIVTGASRGIGYAAALALADEGFDVAAVALPDVERMAELAGKVTALGRRFASYALDLQNLGDHAPVVEATGFDGPVEVEIFSRDRWWKEDPDVVLRTCRERLQTVC